jgi:ribonuclease HI
LEGPGDELGPFFLEKRFVFDLQALKIVIDGACPGNRGGPGGFAAWLEFPFYWDRQDEFLESRGYFNTTNNRMELRACLFAHEWILGGCDGHDVQRVQILTDSRYVHDSYSYSLWWSEDDWHNSHGRAVGNIDLWKELTRIRKKLRGRRRVEVIQIPRCSSVVAKNVDRDAKNAAKSPNLMDDGYKPGKIGRPRNNSGKAPQMFPAAGGHVVVLVYGTNIVRRGLQKVKFQSYSEERRDFFDKFWAYAEDGVANSLHRGNAFLVRMNAAAQNPCIVDIVAPVNKADLIGNEIRKN